jgi:hypothetical protein
MGLWHGAAWTFVLWGVYHAVLVYAHRLLAARFGWLSGRPRVLAGFAVTVPLAMLGWIPFRADGLGTALQLLGKVLEPRAYLSLGMRENTYLVAALVMLMVMAAYFVRETLVHGWRSDPLPGLSPRRRPTAWPSRWCSCSCGRSTSSSTSSSERYSLDTCRLSCGSESP